MFVIKQTQTRSLEAILGRGFTSNEQQTQDSMGGNLMDRIDCSTKSLYVHVCVCVREREREREREKRMKEN